MKKLYLLILVLMPITARAFTGNAEVDGIWYEIVTKGKTATVIKSQGKEYSGDIVIPATIEYEG
jgi:hypothetical protein